MEGQHRIDLIWKDKEAKYYYYLMVYLTQKNRTWLQKEGWNIKSSCYTSDRKFAKRWAKHYRIAMPKPPKDV